LPIRQEIRTGKGASKKTDRVFTTKITTTELMRINNSCGKENVPFLKVGSPHSEGKKEKRDKQLDLEGLTSGKKYVRKTHYHWQGEPPGS